MKIKKKYSDFLVLELRSDRPETKTETIKKDAVKTELLDEIGRDLTALAKEGKFDPVIGREKEMDEVMTILARRRKNNPVLIGNPGIGKTAIIEGIAQKIADGDCPEILENKRIIELDLSTIMSGTGVQGALEEKVKRIILELQDNPDVILFIDEIHMIVDSSKPIDVSNMFKPALARGEMRCIGATTNKEYKIIEKDGALERRFQKVQVEEPTQKETIEILNRLKETYEKFHNVKYSDDAIEACVKLSGRFFTDRFFPDKAIDLLDEVGSKLRMKKTKSPKIVNLEQKLLKVKSAKEKALKDGDFDYSAQLREQEKEVTDELTKEIEADKTANVFSITKKDVESVVSRKLDIPELKTDENDLEKYVKLESNLKMEVIGQDDAVKAISKVLRRNAAGLKDPNRPGGVFLFLGSTGVGKTYTVKMLAKELFGSESNIIRVDMSEYGEKHNVARLIGSPPGYVGYGEGGQLTEQVRRKPHSIVLLDELEKAHPSVLTVLLQVFEDGHLTDGEGKKVDFKNTIIIMTSNIGSSQIKNVDQVVKPLGFGDRSYVVKQDTKEVIMKELQQRLAPEFINRIDDIIIFSSLNKDSIYNIVDIEVKKVTKKLKELGYDLEITDNIKKLLSEKGYDPSMGARPLRRAITKYIEDPISEEIIRKTIKDKIVMDYDPKTEKVLINGNPIIEKLIKSWNKFNRL